MSFLNATREWRTENKAELSQSGESFGGCERANRECGISFGSLLDAFFSKLLLNLMIIVGIVEQNISIVGI